MGLLYSFRHLFYGNKFHKDRLYKLLEKLDLRVTALEQGVDPDGVSISDINDAELVEIAVTYTDDSTDTIKVVAQTPSNESDDS